MFCTLPIHSTDSVLESNIIDVASPSWHIDSTQKVQQKHQYDRRWNIPTTGDEIRQPGQSQIGGCTCKIPLDIRVLRLFPGKKNKQTNKRNTFREYQQLYFTATHLLYDTACNKVLSTWLRLGLFLHPIIYRSKSFQDKYCHPIIITKKTSNKSIVLSEGVNPVDKLCKSSMRFNCTNSPVCWVRETAAYCHLSIRISILNY